MNFLEIFKKDIKFNIGQSINGFYIKNKLGEGRYGIAYLAESCDKKLVTIKQLKKSMLRKNKSNLLFEKAILKELNNSNCNYFPKYIDKFKYNENTKGYILEYIDGETFSDILYKQNKTFTKNEIYAIALRLFDIIEILEDYNIVHKDIRITNVIYTKSKEIKLIDFGLARYIDNKKYKKELDYWYIADFLIHLHYATYKDSKFFLKNKIPWYDDLDLSSIERDFLMTLMGINNKKYDSLNSIRNDLNNILREIYI